MRNNYENTADYFLEIASRQRLGILNYLSEERSKVSIMAKKLNATAPEVHRNFERLQNSALIAKDSDGFFHLTPFGQIMLSQVSPTIFMLDNKKYFQNHDFGNLPQKFIYMLGAFEKVQHVKGFVKVQELWQSIYENANEYIFNILYEVPYTSDIIQTLSKKVSNGIKLRSIFSEYAIIPKERKRLLEKSNFKKLLQQGNIERRMKKDVRVIVVLNERYACAAFPTRMDEVDVSEMFYSDDEKFHEWCLDFFEHCWNTSRSFQESKFES